MPTSEHARECHSDLPARRAQLLRQVLLSIESLPSTVWRYSANVLWGLPDNAVFQTEHPDLCCFFISEAGWNIVETISKAMLMKERRMFARKASSSIICSLMSMNAVSDQLSCYALIRIFVLDVAIPLFPICMSETCFLLPVRLKPSRMSCFPSLKPTNNLLIIFSPLLLRTHGLKRLRAQFTPQVQYTQSLMSQQESKYYLYGEEQAMQTMRAPHFPSGSPASNPISQPSPEPHAGPYRRQESLHATTEHESPDTQTLTTQRTQSLPRSLHAQAVSQPVSPLLSPSNEGMQEEVERPGRLASKRSSLGDIERAGSGPGFGLSSNGGRGRQIEKTSPNPHPPPPRGPLSFPSRIESPSPVPSFETGVQYPDILGIPMRSGQEQKPLPRPPRSDTPYPGQPRRHTPSPALSSISAETVKAPNESFAGGTANVVQAQMPRKSILKKPSHPYSSNLERHVATSAVTGSEQADQAYSHPQRSSAPSYSSPYDPEPRMSMDSFTTPAAPAALSAVDIIRLFWKRTAAKIAGYLPLGPEMEDGECGDMVKKKSWWRTSWFGWSVILMGWALLWFVIGGVIGLRMR